jgi:hypothetical protein
MHSRCTRGEHHVLHFLQNRLSYFRSIQIIDILYHLVVDMKLCILSLSLVPFHLNYLLCPSLRVPSTLRSLASVLSSNIPRYPSSDEILFRKTNETKELLGPDFLCIFCEHQSKENFFVPSGELKFYFIEFGESSVRVKGWIY